MLVVCAAYERRSARLELREESGCLRGRELVGCDRRIELRRPRLESG
jgi:hypothetical protein